MLVADVAVLFQSLSDDIVQFGRQPGVELQCRHRFLCEQGREDESRSISRERRASRGHFIEHQAEREQIRAGVQFFSAGLLGRHISHGSDCCTGTGEQRLGDGYGGGLCWRPGNRPRRAFRHQFRQTKIHDLGLTSRDDEDIGRLDIAMDNAFRVGHFQCVGDLDSQLEQLVYL